MRYILFGDSIAAGVGDFENGGWATQLRLFIDRDKKAKDHTLLNLSIGGDTTRSFLNRMETEGRLRMRDYPPEEFTYLIAVGTNDSRTNKADPTQDISPEEFESNIHKLLEIASKFSRKTILIGLVPVDESRTTSYKENKFYTVKRMKEFNNLLQKIAEEKELRFVNFFPEWLKRDRKKLFEDGLHPNTQWHQLMFQSIREALLHEEQ